uniref:Uncharacterized protein n=1 Tax=Oryza barthii TaxID=65489 RepID=A0A0D3FS17_9ORYZ
MAFTGFLSAAAAASSSSPRPPDQPLPICSALASYTEEPTSFVLVGGRRSAFVRLRPPDRHHRPCLLPSSTGQSENPDAASMQKRIILTAMYIETFIIFTDCQIELSLDLNDIRVIYEDIGSLRMNENNPTVIHLLREGTN